MNMNLKVAIVRSGKRQYQIASETGIDDTLLSMYVTGRRPIRKHHLQSLAKVLKVSQKSLVG